MSFIKDAPQNSNDSRKKMNLILMYSEFSPSKFKLQYKVKLNKTTFDRVLNSAKLNFF